MLLVNDDVVVEVAFDEVNEDGGTLEAVDAGGMVRFFG